MFNALGQKNTKDFLQDDFDENFEDSYDRYNIFKETPNSINP